MSGLFRQTEAAKRVGISQLTAAIMNNIHCGRPSPFALSRAANMRGDRGLPRRARIRSQTMPLISPERMQDRYDTILDAAKYAFASKGFEGASIADIARIAAISDGLVYRYFRNKRELLYGVMQKFYERILVDLETEVFKQKSFRARLEALIKRHIEVFISDTDLCRLFIAEVRVASDYEGSPIQELNRRYTSVLIRIVREAVKIGEVRGNVNPKLLRDVIFGSLEHLAWGHVNGHRQLKAAQTARDLTNMLTSGICLDD